MNETSDSDLQGFVLVAAVNNGKQVAFVYKYRTVGVPGRREVQLKKWKRQSRMWTDGAWYPVTVIVGPAGPDDLKHYNVR